MLSEQQKDLQKSVDLMAAIERAIRGENAVGAIWPNWVYEARAAVRHMGENPPPWLPDLMAVLGWQGGTVHDVINAVRRLVEADKERSSK